MKIGVVASFPNSLVRFRGRLIERLIDEGHSVVCFAPEPDEDLRAAITRLGAEYVVVPMSRAGVNPVGDLMLLIKLYAALRKCRVDRLISYTIKPVVYGSLAGRIAGVGRMYSIVTGLGVVYTSTGFVPKVLRLVTDTLYRIGLPQNEVVFFQNPDDRKLFADRGLLRRVSKTQLLNGSGVDVDEFSFSPVPDAPFLFTLIGRLIVTKGVREYTAAARRILDAYPEARFLLVGLVEEGHLDALSDEDMDLWRSHPRMELQPWGGDIKKTLDRTSVYVLPSYREGLPRTVLEAMSVGRPIITSDAPGCRETVKEGVNGMLVPVGDVDSLVVAMERFLNDKELLSQMGSESRKFAEERFDVRRVNQTIIGEMGL